MQWTKFRDLKANLDVPLQNMSTLATPLPAASTAELMTKSLRGTNKYQLKSLCNLHFVVVFLDD